MKNNITYELEINTEKALKDLEKIKQTIKSCEFEINKLRLKRKDILVIKIHKENDLDKIKRKIKKQIHRKILILDEKTSIYGIISNK